MCFSGYRGITYHEGMSSSQAERKKSELMVDSEVDLGTIFLSNFYEDKGCMSITEQVKSTNH